MNLHALLRDMLRRYRHIAYSLKLLDSQNLVADLHSGENF